MVIWWILERMKVQELIEKLKAVPPEMEVRADAVRKSFNRTGKEGTKPFEGVELVDVVDASLHPDGTCFMIGVEWDDQ